ncbi:unnamed protein product [Linum trigynum]|uniref:Uncharacterized protein n=1 Tax=Linum trigynum TaxID=586398 RepID=A0AAV2FWZ6_9ROSI
MKQGVTDGALSRSEGSGNGGSQGIPVGVGWGNLDTYDDDEWAGAQGGRPPTGPSLEPNDIRNTSLIRGLGPNMGCFTGALLYGVDPGANEGGRAGERPYGSGMVVGGPGQAE